MGSACGSVVGVQLAQMCEDMTLKKVFAVGMWVPSPQAASLCALSGLGRCGWAELLRGAGTQAAPGTENGWRCQMMGAAASTQHPSSSTAKDRLHLSLYRTQPRRR